MSKIFEPSFVDEVNCVALPSYRMEDMEDIRRKLTGCVIVGEKTPLRVQDAVMSKELSVVVLRCRNCEGTSVEVPYTEKVKLSVPRPGYITANNQAFMFVRPPYRQQMQGVTSQNAVFYTAAKDRQSKNIGNDQLLQCFRRRPIVRWNNHIEACMHDGLMENIRLSNNIALYVVDDNQIFLGHKNLEVGPVLRDNKVKLLDPLGSQKWLKRDLKEVGLELE